MGEVLHYENNIKIKNNNKITGYMDGTIGSSLWSVIVEKVDNEQGLNPLNMRTGKGRIVKLCIYADDADVEGNPFTPTVTIKRHIYASYDHGWDNFNRKYMNDVFELVNYINARLSIHAL